MKKPLNQIDYCMTIIKELPTIKNKRYARFLCNCGNTIDTRIDSVKHNRTISCGCAVKGKRGPQKNKKQYKTGDTNKYGVRLVGIFSKMKDRCYNPKHLKYDYYGGRGITICKEWLENTNLFFDWALINGYTDTLTIDRKDNDGNYTPNNCAWKTRSYQSQNTRLLSIRNKTGYRGVSKNTSNLSPFRARIGFAGKQYLLGYYNTELEAAKAFDSWVIIHKSAHTINGVDLFNDIKGK